MCESLFLIPLVFYFSKLQWGLKPEHEVLREPPDFSIQPCFQFFLLCMAFSDPQRTREIVQCVVHLPCWPFLSWNTISSSKNHQEQCLSRFRSKPWVSLSMAPSFLPSFFPSSLTSFCAQCDPWTSHIKLNLSKRSLWLLSQTFPSGFQSLWWSGLNHSTAPLNGAEVLMHCLGGGV